MACLALTLVMMIGLQQNRSFAVPVGESVALMDAHPGHFPATAISDAETADLDDYLDDAGWTMLPAFVFKPSAARIAPVIAAISESSDVTLLERPPRTAA